MADRLRSAAARTALFYGLAFAIITAAVGFTIYRVARAELERQLDARILAERRELLHAFDAGGMAALGKAVTTRSAQGGSGDMRYTILDRAGRRREGLPVLDVELEPSGWDDVAFRHGSEAADPARALITALPNGERLVVGADSDSIEQIDRRMVRLFALAFGAMIAAGVAGGLALSRALSRRIDAIDRTARAIVAGRLDHRIPLLGSHDEFDRLSATLNAMLDRIGALMDNLRQVSGDVAHDLRTPLSRLRQRLETALAEAGDAAALERAVHASLADIDDMLALFAAILGISEIEAGAARSRFTTVALSELAADISESYLPAAEDGGRALSWRIAPGIRISGERELLAQLAVNLLDNALHHTPPGSRITVDLGATGDEATLTVADDGPGIPEAERASVFKRFTRLERSRSTPGHGLGLSLVAAIAQLHHARLALDDNRPGVRMTVTFARVAAA